MQRRHGIAGSLFVLILAASLRAQAPAAEAPTPSRRTGDAHAGAAPPSHPSAYSDDAYRAILQFYQYDAGMPLNAQMVEREDTPAYVREKIVFTGVRDSRVPAYLGLPKTGTRPYPVVLLIDGITGSKERWWQDDSWPHGGLATKQLLASGYAVLALDAQYHGERTAANEYESPGRMYFERKWYNRTREMILQTTVEHRRAIDYLATRPEIDGSRIGLLGHSMGGMIIFALNASDARVKTSVACVTPLNIWEPRELAVISPFNFARGVGRRPFLMLMGRSDPFYSAAESELLLSMVEGAPKELMFYDTGHRLPPQYISKAHEWFETHLK